MTPERIKELRALAKKAVPGWTARGRELVDQVGCGPDESDAAFLAAAANALTELLTDYENHRALAQRADRMRETIRKVEWSGGDFTCPECGNFESENHLDTCSIREVLGTIRIKQKCESCGGTGNADGLVFTDAKRCAICSGDGYVLKAEGA